MGREYPDFNKRSQDSHVYIEGIGFIFLWTDVAPVAPSPLRLLACWFGEENREHITLFITTYVRANVAATRMFSIVAPSRKCCGWSCKVAHGQKGVSANNDIKLRIWMGKCEQTYMLQWSAWNVDGGIKCMLFGGKILCKDGCGWWWCQHQNNVSS